MNDDIVAKCDTRHVKSEGVSTHTQYGHEEEYHVNEAQHIETEAQGILISLKPGGQDVMPRVQEQDTFDHRDQAESRHNSPYDHYHDDHGYPDEQEPLGNPVDQQEYDPSAPIIRQQQPVDSFLLQNIKVEETDVYGIESHQAMDRPAHHMNRPVDHFRLYEQSSDSFQDIDYEEDDVGHKRSMSRDTYSGVGTDYNMETNQAHQDKDPYDGIKSGFDLFRNKGIGYQSRGYSGDQNRPRENKQGPNKSNIEGISHGFQARNYNQDQEDVSEQDIPLGQRGQVMSRAKKAFIDERASLERPNRSLFVRNIDYNTSVEDVRAMFEPYGDIQSLFSLIDSRGMIFITYYDIRAAEYAKKEANEKLLNDRPLDVHFSLPKENKHRPECQESDHNGTLFVYIRGMTNEHIPNEELENFFSRYGDVKNVFSRKDAEHQKFVEFFDSRACARAFHGAQGTSFRHGIVDCKFAWDHYRPTPAHLRGTAAKNYDRNDDKHNRPNYTRTPSPSRDRSNSRQRDSRDRGKDNTYSSKKSRDRSNSRDRDSRSKHDRQDSKDYHSRSRNDNYKRNDRDKDRGRDRSRDRSRERRNSIKDRSRDRSRDRSKDRDRSRDRGRSRDRDRSRARDRSKDRDRSRGRDRSRDRNRSKDRNRSRDRDYKHDRDRDHNRGRDRSRSLSRDRNLGFNNNNNNSNNNNRYRQDSPPRTFHKPGSLIDPNRREDQQVRPSFPNFQSSQNAPVLQFFPPSLASTQMLNPLDISAQQRMEQAQKAQQLVNEMLISAGKAVPGPTSQPMFGNMSYPPAPPVPPIPPAPPAPPIPPIHPLSLGQPMQPPPMPQPPIIGLPKPPVPPMPPMVPSRPPVSADPRSPIAPVAHTVSEASKLATSMPMSSTPPSILNIPSQPVISVAPIVASPSPAPALAIGHEPSKSTTEAQVQQLLQLLTQVQQQTQGTHGVNANGNQSVASGQVASSGVMALLPHLSQLSQLVQQNFQPQQQQGPQPSQPPQVLSTQYHHATQPMNYGNMAMTSGMMGMMMSPSAPPAIPVPPPSMPVMPSLLATTSNFGQGGFQDKQNEGSNIWYKNPSENQDQGKNFSDHNSNANGVKRQYSEVRKDWSKDWDKDWDKDWNRKGHANDFKRRREDDDDRDDFRTGGSSRNYQNNNNASSGQNSYRRESSVASERHTKRENEDDYHARNNNYDEDYNNRNGNDTTADWDEPSNEPFQRNFNYRGRGRGRGRARGGWVDRGRGRGGSARGGGHNRHDNREGNEYNNDNRDGENRNDNSHGSGNYNGGQRGSWTPRGRGRGRGNGFRGGRRPSYADDRF
ncbi:hypothetical protein FBU30_003363 [Linnemannia zychae]|nr:hypothetical protein FBU30_003363 [Linnemannia zychae]